MVWLFPASGYPESTCFYGRAGVPGAQSGLFLHAVLSREFQRLVFLLAFGASGAADAVFSRAFRTLDLAPSRGGPGAARGGDSRRGSGPFSDCTVTPGGPGVQEHRTTVKMHVIEAPSVLPWGPLFPPGTTGRSARPPGSAFYGFGADFVRTWPESRRWTPLSPSGKNRSPRTPGGSGAPVRAAGPRFRRFRMRFPVAVGMSGGPETGLPGRRGGLGRSWVAPGRSWAGPRRSGTGRCG